MTPHDDTWLDNPTDFEFDEPDLDEDENSYFYDDTCPVCHGRGFIWDGPEECSHCNGEGYEWWR